ncbi:MAG: DUF3153 domain-containing protein [Firmicutes bacterium]|nr:DUF3153 domain-containing protein [Bacillota bacterium]
MNKKRLLILIGMIFLLTGCVKYNLDMGVGKDKSISITIIDAIQKEYAGSLENTDSLEEYKKLGYEVETYNDNGYTGLKLTKKFNSIDEISSSDVQTFELTDLLDLETTNYKIFNSNKIGTTTTYKANFTYDLTMAETEGSNEEVDYSAYSDSMIFTYKISLPNNAKIITHNADEKSSDGYTLTWNMKYGELKNINFTFTIDDNDVTTDPGNNNNTNDNNNNNDNDNENQTPPVNDDGNGSENNNDIKDSANNNSSDKKSTDKTNKLGPIIGALLSIVIILGLLVYKIKLKKEEKTPNTKMSHTQAPKR